MRQIPSFIAVLAALTALAACGTRTPLTLPPPPAGPNTTVAPAPTPAAVDNTNKAVAEPRQ